MLGFLLENIFAGHVDIKSLLNLHFCLWCLRSVSPVCQGVFLPKRQTGLDWSLFGFRERRSTWAEERRMNSETFGIPLRHTRGRGGYRGRGFMGPRGGRGRPMSRGSFGPPRGAPPGFRGAFRGGRGGRDFSDFEYRVSYLKCIFKSAVCRKMRRMIFLNFCCFFPEG